MGVRDRKGDVGEAETLAPIGAAATTPVSPAGVREATPSRAALAETGVSPGDGWTVASEPQARPKTPTVGPGTTIGRYEIVARLGQGGMGVVYRAKDPRLDRDIALKLVTPGDGDVAMAQARLEREAKAMAQVSNVNVAAIHDIGAWREQIYIAMELCPGGSLGAWLRADRRAWRDVMGRFLAAGRGLAAAHRHGLVHRDFKPDNVLIGRDDVIKVSDFGLVRSGSVDPETRQAKLSAAASGKMSAAGTLIGTPAYMAPEQIAGEPAEAAADQFAFAVSLWEGLTGQRPFQPAPNSPDPLGALFDSVKSGRLSDPPPMLGVPQQVWGVLQRALAIDPAKRWPSMATLLGELDHAIAPRRRNRGLLYAVIAVAVIGLGTGGFVLLRSRRTTDTAIRRFERAAHVAELVQRASNASEARRYDEAVAALHEAYQLTQDPELLRKIGDVHRRGMHCGEALHAYEGYLALVKTPTPAVRYDISQFRKGCDQYEAVAGVAMSRELDVDVIVERAAQFQRVGDFEAAEAAYAHAFDVSGNFEWQFALGNVYMDAGDCHAASETFADFMKHAPHAEDMKQWVDDAKERCKSGKVDWAE